MIKYAHFVALFAFTSSLRSMFSIRISHPYLSLILSYSLNGDLLGMVQSVWCEVMHQTAPVNPVKHLCLLLILPVQAWKEHAFGTVLLTDKRCCPAMHITVFIRFKQIMLIMGLIYYIYHYEMLQSFGCNSHSFCYGECRSVSIWAFGQFIGFIPTLLSSVTIVTHCFTYSIVTENKQSSDGKFIFKAIYKRIWLSAWSSDWASHYTVYLQYKQLNSLGYFCTVIGLLLCNKLVAVVEVLLA